MAELLAQIKTPLRVFRVGDVVEGIVTEKTNRAVYIDIGGKTEGVVIDREIKAAKDFVKDLQVGDKVMAVVTQAENEKGQIILSLKKAAIQKAWDELEEKMKTEETIRVKGLQVTKGGLLVEVKGLQGFIPVSQFSSAFSGKIDQLMGKELEVKLIQVDRAKNRLIFSEKEVSEKELLEEQKRVLRKIKVGEVFSGEVKGVMPFGLFVKIKVDKIELEGLVHISEISWERVEDPSKFYKQGDKVKLKVLKVDRKTGKLNFSIKKLFPDPWAEIEKKYPLEAKVKGTVVRLAPFGIFVKLEPGIEGLIHISKIPAEKTFEIGEKVECFIESLDKENRRLSLDLVLKEKPVGYK